MRRDLSGLKGVGFTVYIFRVRVQVKGLGFGVWVEGQGLGFRFNWAMDTDIAHVSGYTKGSRKSHPPKNPITI